MQRNYKANSILFREGDPSGRIYRLITGGAEVTSSLPGRTEVIGAIQPGEFIGEMGVLVACRRSGTARFTVDSTVEEFNRLQFLELISADPALSTRLLAVLSLRTRSQIELLQKLPEREVVDRMRRQNFPLWFGHLFGGAVERCSEFMRLRLKNHFRSRGAKAIRRRADLTPRVFPAGSWLFEEGQVSENVYWIEKGRVHIIKKLAGKDHRVGYAVPNEFIGEMGVLESLPRNASARASTDVVARVISPSQFYDLVQQSSAAYSIVIDSLCDRVRKLRRITRDITVAAAPVTPRDEAIFEAARSVESVAQLAEQRLVDEAVRARRFFLTQWEHGKFIAQVYQRYLRGEASKEEMERANGYFRDYVKMAGLGTLFILPGAAISIPLAVKIGKAVGIDILPAEVEESHPPLKLTK